MALIDFTRSNARRFYSSMGNPLGWKGLKSTFFPHILAGGNGAVVRALAFHQYGAGSIS